MTIGTKRLILNQHRSSRYSLLKSLGIKSASQFYLVKFSTRSVLETFKKKNNQSKPLMSRLQKTWFKRRFDKLSPSARFGLSGSWTRSQGGGSSLGGGSSARVRVAAGSRPAARPRRGRRRKGGCVSQPRSLSFRVAAASSSSSRALGHGGGCRRGCPWRGCGRSAAGRRARAVPAPGGWELFGIPGQALLNQRCRQPSSPPFPSPPAPARVRDEQQRVGAWGRPQPCSPCRSPRSCRSLPPLGRRRDVWEWPRRGFWTQRGSSCSAGRLFPRPWQRRRRSPFSRPPPGAPGGTRSGAASFRGGSSALRGPCSALPGPRGQEPCGLRAALRIP